MSTQIPPFLAFLWNIHKKVRFFLSFSCKSAFLFSLHSCFLCIFSVAVCPFVRILCICVRGTKNNGCIYCIVKHTSFHVIIQLCTCTGMIHESPASAFRFIVLFQTSTHAVIPSEVEGSTHKFVLGMRRFLDSPAARSKWHTGVVLVR